MIASKGLAMQWFGLAARFTSPISQLLCIVMVFSSCASAIAEDLQAEKYYSWEFERDDDRNLDQSPDGWRRQRDRQHPAYIVSRLVPRDAQHAQAANVEQLFTARVLQAIKQGYWDFNYIPESIPPELAAVMDRYVFNNCLEVIMDGGAAEVVSPVIPMDPRFSYSMSAELSSGALDGHEAWVELQLLDGKEQPLETLATDRITGTNEWQRLSTSIASAPGHELAWGRVHLKVEPSDKSIIHGIARFDSIVIQRLPRLSLTTDLPEHVARPQQEFAVTCAAMGIRNDNSTVRFELRDHLRRLILAESVPLSHRSDSLQGPAPTSEFATSNSEPATQHSASRYVSTKSSRSQGIDASAGTKPSSTGEEAIYDGTAIWELQLEHPGLYRVNVRLGDGGDAQDREILIGVMPKYPNIQGGPFGWSITSLDSNVTPEDLPPLAEKFGAGWVKFPVWFEMMDIQAANRLVKMTEQLQLLGVQCVGRIDQPPESQRELFGDRNTPLYAVNIFQDSKAWEPVLEPVLTQMGLKLDWFQIGSDADKSFQTHPDLISLVTEIRSRIQTYSQELRLAMCWTWPNIQADGSGMPWNAMQYDDSPQLTATELLSYASEADRRGENVWVTINPLDRKSYRLLDRVRDLTERMVVVKQARISAAYVIDPFDQQHGIFQPDKSIGEMLIPWTTLVAAIGDKSYLGPVQLPGGSQNHAFNADDVGVMLLWSDEPRVEELFLGKDVTATDIWGRPLEIEQLNERDGLSIQRFSVGPWPIIVHGIDVNVVRWRQQFQVETANLASTIGEQQLLEVTVVNAFDQPVTGQLSLAAPSLLGGNRAELPLQITRAGRQKLGMSLNVRPDASTGKHNLRFDIDVTNGLPYHFSVYREIKLGNGDVEFKWDLSRKGPSLAELRIELINNTTEPISFDCKYFPVGRPYQRFQILDARPGITLHDVNINVTPEDERAGAWIRCEEIGQGRVLNYRLTQ